MKILKLHNWVHIIQITKENVSSLESLCVPSQLPCSLASHILPSTPNNGVTTILNWTYYSVLFTGVILIYTYLIIWLYNFLKFENWFMKEVEPDFHREWEMSSHPRYLRPWRETQRPTTSSLVGPQSKSESFFTATERFCRWSSGTHGAGDAGNCLVGEGFCQEGQGPHGAKKRHPHSTEGPWMRPGYSLCNGSSYDTWIIF